LTFQLAEKYDVRFADVFWPMLTEGFVAKNGKYGLDYALSGKDGVHPDWAGHVVMAYAFLKAMGLDGGIGTFTVDLAADRRWFPMATRWTVHHHTLTITSHRYPFCAPAPPTAMIPFVPACPSCRSMQI